MSILLFSTGEERKLRDSIAQYLFEMEYANCIERHMHAPRIFKNRIVEP